MKKTDLKTIINEKITEGASFAEVFMEHKQTLSIRLEDNKIEQLQYGRDCGAGIRQLRGDKTFYNYTNNTDFPFDNDEFDTKTSLSQKVAILEKVNKIARKISPKIIQVMVSYSQSNQKVHIANSEGLSVDDLRQRQRFAINVIASDNGVVQTGFEAPGCTGNCFDDLFKRHEAEALAEMAAKRALQMLAAPVAPAGEMPVVLMSEAGGTMIHEACGHSLEADFIMKKTSIFSNKKGKKIASPLITVIDDSTLPGNFGSHKYDDEGVPAKKTVLIEKGILKNFMTDRLTAKILKLPLSSNGRRESFRNRPVPRMTNTYILPGKDSPSDIIKSVDKGLLVKRMGGGQVDVTNGEFVFEVSEGYLIEKGAASTPVRGATLIGSGSLVLSTVDMVGNDLLFQEGVCGKYDHAPVSDAQPTLRIPKIVVGGQL